MNNNLYDFDAPFIEVQINARPGASSPVIVSHKLRKPTLQELLDREKAISLEIVETSNREEQIVTDDDSANCQLWDRLIVEIKGYAGIPDWQPISDQQKMGMRPGHKRTSIVAMYAGSAQIIGGDEDEISLSMDTWTIRQMVGPDADNPLYTIDHVLREPTESERAKFKRNASKVSFVRGAKRARTKIGADLRAYVEIYDALVTSIDGGMVAGKTFKDSERGPFLAAIDPTWKRVIVQTLMNAIEAALLD